MCMAGSGAKVALICTASPAASQLQQTRNTIKFAMRAKKVPFC